MPELAISAEKVAFIIEKAREFDVKQAMMMRSTSSRMTAPIRSSTNSEVSSWP
jgi:hypothetical protein